MTVPPLLILVIGIATVLGLIIVLRVNAFIALITAAMLVSLLGPGATAVKISRVAEAFGENAGKIGIVIALAAVIGKCMMDSGAADRVVRGFLNLLGEKRSPWALMGSGYVLAVPVFFDTVFYLLVPLARSFYRRTGTGYLKCILAIAAGGAITHTLVPPTPGPLTMAATLNIDLGVMIGIGALVALPAAIAGIAYAQWADRRYDIPMRATDGEEAPALSDEQLPSLILSLAPVVLPVLLIAAHTTCKTLAQPELAAHARELRQADDTLTEKAALQQAETDWERGLVAGRWSRVAQITAVLGNANLALLLSTVIALWMYYAQRHPTLTEMAKSVEVSLMSGGVIILITAAGASFGQMLKVAEVGTAIQELFGQSNEAAAGMGLLWIGFGIAMLLKMAQGSSTAAMIIASSMLAGIVQGHALPYHPVYLATAIGAGSLIGSWMNDSGFWIFAKMGGLTEVEALKTWSVLLVVLGAVSMAVTLVLATVLPMAGGV